MAELMISADDHIDLGYLPSDLWTERLPASLKERGPRVVEQPNGTEQWVCDGHPWGEWRAGKWFHNPKRRKIALDRFYQEENFTRRPTTAELRLQDMERDGVEASLMFPPIFGMRTIDRELAKTIIATYNDWAADFAKASPQRLFSIAQLYPDDAEASTEELLRVAKLGIKQVNFLVGTVTSAMYQPEWDRFWDAAQDADVIVSYHVGGVTREGTAFIDLEREAKTERKPAFGMGLGDGATTFFNPFVGLFTHGVLERRPKLKVVLGESGIGWIPFVVQEMDYRFKQTSTGGARDASLNPAIYPLKKLPSEVFREQVWATYQQDLVGLHLIDFFGDGHIMWASDYPHPDSTWPNSQAVVERETAHLDPATKRKVLRENAAKLYGLAA
ncbi:MAG TPA: amidohydrolase family protein [Chloroflexota bacterium]|nr:amidohydrolase family protein [Chloroflexota bacterium]